MNDLTSRTLNLIATHITTPDPESTLGSDYISIPSISPEEADLIRERLVKSPTFQQLTGRFNYDGEFSQIRITKPDALINTPARWLQAQETYWKARGMLPDTYDNDVTSLCGIEFKGFNLPHTSTTKTPNFSLMPWSSLFPSIVVETGHTQPLTDLERDKEIWKTSTNGQTKVVLITKFTKTARGTVSCFVDIHRVNGLGGVGICSRFTIFPPPPDNAEQSYPISLGEVYGGECPDGIDPDVELPFNISELRNMCRQTMMGLNFIPDS
ncbi:hypothetical protein TWF694_009201 [Orbilia ellipsospora]|uniref:Uncharacterized protein n=1 Tax=Orbilia ellipsospora TaxID=2528407 RepID=A0AAV9XFM0_9PEZI